MRIAILLAVAAAFITTCSDSYHAGEVMITEPWSRAMPPVAKAGAVYVTLTNHGEEPISLVAVSSPIADKAELHGQKMVDGVIKMRPLASIEIPPNESASLQPSGSHVMLLGLKESLEDGKSFPLTLTFSDGKAADVMVKITKNAPKGGAHKH